MKCPVRNNEWYALVKELGTPHRAYRAYILNGEEIPDINSTLVKAMKTTYLAVGPIVKIYEFTKSGLKKVITNEYKKEEGSTIKYYDDERDKPYGRVTEFINNWLNVNRDETKSYGELVAERRWGTLDRTTKLSNREGKLETFEEAVASVNKATKNAEIKGKIIHKYIQSRLQPSNSEVFMAEINELLKEIDQTDDKFARKWEWIKQPDVVEKIIKRSGINIFDKFPEEDDFLKDEVFSEVTIASELLGLAGTADLLAEHADGSFTVVDFKTGNNVSGSYLVEEIMKYGETNSLDVVENKRNKAKLQVALYAMLIKANNPNAKFRNLIVTWIPGLKSVYQLDNDQYVPAQPYVQLLERFFMDKEAIKKAGLPEDIHAQLIAASPNIFNHSHYTSNYSSGLVGELIHSPLHASEILDKKIRQLQLVVARQPKFSDLSKSEQTLVMELEKDISALLADTEQQITVEGKLIDDISSITRWLGNYSDMRHPMVQTWNDYRHEMNTKLDQVYQEKMRKFQGLQKEVIDDYHRDKGLGTLTPFGRRYNYNDVYGFAYKMEDVEGLSYKRERLLTKDDGVEWEILTPAQKNLLQYVNDEIASYFEGENAFLNQAAMNKTEEEKMYTGGAATWSHLDIFNSDKGDNEKFKYYKGFFFKTEPTQQEFLRGYKVENGNKPSLGQRMKASFYQSLTNFTEKAYLNLSGKDEFSFVPIKYMGSPKIESDQLYSKHLELMFSKAIYALEHKRHFDGVLQTGKALQHILLAQTDADGKQIYKNTAAFMSDKLFGDIVGARKEFGWVGRKIRMPVLTPQGLREEPVDLDKVLFALMSWASMTTMWLKPFQGFGNGVHGMLLTHRDGLKGSLAGVTLLGINGNNIDFTEKDIATADALYFAEYTKAAMQGDLRKNKMWLLAKKLNYFGNNFDYATLDKNLMIKSTRYFSKSHMYMFHSIPEDFLSMTTMTAQLLHMKDKTTGKSLWDLYDVEEVDGVWDVVYNGGIRGYEKIGTELAPSGKQDTAIYRPLQDLSSKEIAKLKKVHERLQGGYRKDEAASIEYYALGKAFMQFKKYFPRLLLNAMHSKRYEADLGYYEEIVDEKTGMPILKDGLPIYEWHRRVSEGRWRTLAHAMAYVITFGHTNQKYNWNLLGDEQKQNLIEAGLTMLMWASAYIGYITMFQDIDDDDTAKKWWKMYLVDNLSQQYNVYDLLKTLKTGIAPVAIAKLYTTVESLTTMMIGTASYGLTGREEYLFTEKDELRGWNNFKKQIPGVASYVDIYSKLTNDKSGVLYSDFATLRLR
jgi:hypothetical protein